MFGMDYRQIQEQKQILSQRMIQSAEILQMDVQELKNYIQQQALENPMIDLEKIERGMDESGESGKNGDREEQEEFRRKLEWLNHMDEQNRVYYSKEYEEAQTQEPWNFAVEENNLQEYLLSQLVMQIKTEKDYECLEFLAYSLDSKGYLTDDMGELARKLRIDEETMMRYLEILQSAEPAGVGARSLEECLQIQLIRMRDNGLVDENDFGFLMELAGAHMEELGKRRFTQVGRQMKLPAEEVVRYYEMIRKLNPIPGNSFSSREKMRYVKPDVTVVKFEDYFEVLVNEANVPRVAVNRYYLNMMKADNSVEVQEYLQNKYRQTQWIQRCIEERTCTLKKVAMEIVDIQKAFFEDAGNKRVPMSLKDVAKRLDVHESTVSRAVKNKFLQCAWGVYPMNYFFAKRVTSDPVGEEMTSENVKQKIQAIIEKENKKKPLSDQKISDCLKTMGIDVSRRTVAKYRSELMIPDTTGRKKHL